MNDFSVSDIITSAAQTTWKHKTLWIIPAAVMLVSLIAMPISFFFNPLYAPMLSSSLARVAEAPWFSLIGSGLNVILSLVAGGLGIIASALLTVGTLRAHAGADKLSIPDVFRESAPYFLRVLGIGALFFISFFIVWMGFVFVGVFVSIFTFGLGFLCFMPLMLLMIPVIFIAYGWIDLSYAAVIVENLNVFEAFKRAWNLYKQNFWKVVLVTLVVYVGLMLIVGVVMIPIMLPFFAMPFAVIANEGASLSNTAQLRTMVIFTSLCAAAYAPIYAIIQGAVMTFMRAAWTFTYLRLIAQPEPLAAPVQSFDATPTSQP